MILLVKITAGGSSKDALFINITDINQTLRNLDLLLDGIELEVDEMLKDFTKEYHKEVVDSAPKDTTLYSKKWYWNQTNIGKFVIYNDVSQVYNPDSEVHYSRYLTEKNDRFLGIAGSGGYKYADPYLGIIHDISQINTIMANVLEQKVDAFTLRKVQQRKKL